MLKFFKFLQPLSFNSTGVRNCARFNPKNNKTKLYKDGDRQLIEGRISFYPRFPNEPEPTHEAPKLFKVTRIKKMKGLPHWEKRILRDMGLYNPGSVTVIKNIPDNNARLWKVKHLIKMEPVTFPQGEPTANDVNHTFLRENGQCLVVKEIGDTLKKRSKLLARSKLSESVMDQKTLKKDSRLKWLNPYQ